MFIPIMLLCFQHRKRYTEIFDGQEFVRGPDLPVDAYRSCATEVEPGIVFISGEQGTGHEAYMIDVDSGSVTMLPEMPEARGLHACGIVPSSSGGLDIVVAGGNDDDSVIIFNTQLGIWRPGPSLPTTIEDVCLKKTFC